MVCEGCTAFDWLGSIAGCLVSPQGSAYQVSNLPAEHTRTARSFKMLKKLIGCLQMPDGTHMPVDFPILPEGRAGSSCSTYHTMQSPAMHDGVKVPSIPIFQAKD